MDEGYQWLQSIADRMNGDVAKGAAPRPEQLTVRQLLQRFGYHRRGDLINSHIRNGLEKFKLRTDQDVTVAWLDSPITIELDSDATGGARYAPNVRSHASGCCACGGEPETCEGQTGESPTGSDHDHADERLLALARDEERAGRVRRGDLGVNR